MNNNKGLFIGIAVVVVILIAVITAMAITGNNNNGDKMSMDNKSESSKSSDTKSADTSKAVEATSVTIQNFAFDAPLIKVKVGTTVTWTNKDGVSHNVSPDAPSADFTVGKLIGKDETYSFTFNKAGTYSYHCNPHPYMKGTVVVTQ